ncbi:shikimate dehydrogenase [Breoghania sp. L-A4]|uniref:shikimate dehydrogenase n=1 Tax=Breoghania sp. L-A4 TaxID=2304600 RepID=UPI000E35E8D8|nr:shikimate dehydrogenase [Breoghania sp. L-A4]AXS38816.1 shikimate dehydrogenase [Breoghania sp. L-A4]
MTPIRAAVIGWPISHSRSPVIHSYWLHEYAISGSYERLAVPPERIREFLRSFERTGLKGANVTIPHKQVALSCCDSLDEAAEAIGAVNTLVFEDGRLSGSNTDGLGFLGSLDQNAPGWDAAGGAAVVLGAGGAARAIVWALKARGLNPIHVVNRTLSRAQDLAARFGAQAHGLDALPALLGEAAVLVNTTSQGMNGQSSMDIDLGLVRATCLVTDIVYVPLETEFLAAARARGLRTVDGLGMLLHQAVPGFELWFGVRPEVTGDLRATVLRDMGLAELAQ